MKVNKELEQGGVHNKSGLNKNTQNFEGRVNQATIQENDPLFGGDRYM